MFYLNIDELINAYQVIYPDLLLDEYLQLYANEAFLRRANFIGGEFLLKGSFVGREYFYSPSLRYPNDLDFVYLNHDTNANHIEHKLSKWVNGITCFNYNDGVTFTPFDKNTNWGLADYDDICEDFQTLNTEVICTLFNKKIELNLDISIHLSLYNHPTPLIIHTLIDDLYFENTVAISTQIAWKLHQTIIYPRAKDIYDLIYLLHHIQNKQDVISVMNELLFEFKSSNPYNGMDIAELFKNPTEFIHKKIGFFIKYRAIANYKNIDGWYQSTKHTIKTNNEFKTAEKLLYSFTHALKKTGFNQDLINHQYAFLFNKTQYSHYLKSHFNP